MQEFINKKENANELENFSQVLNQQNENKFGLLELKKLKEIFSYKDMRTVMNWCNENDLFVIQQGNKQFVNQWDFILTFYKPYIEYLKSKHKNWKTLFINYINGDLNSLLVSPSEPVVQSTTKYVPSTKQATSFLNNIKQL